MTNNETKKMTVEALDVMIQNVDYGLSGFWVDNYEGCGNPKIFPEFKEGLKRGHWVQKKHYLCPWNTAVLFGKDYGNMNSGCYYSCSIDKARFLSTEMMKDVLIRFRERLIQGVYDHKEDVLPLLTVDEVDYIENAIKRTRQLEERKRNEKQRTRLKKAAALIAKYPDKKYLLAAYYGEKDCICREDGVVFFDPNSQKDVVGAEKMSYDEYLSVQLASLGCKYRASFVNAIFNYLLEFKGQIETIKEKYICFKRIFIIGMYSDGVMFDDKEDHVWMDRAGFEQFDVGDSVSFGAEVYRYIKKGKGKRIDFGLRNPVGIKRIEKYKLPSDDELCMQMIDQIVCETCYLSEGCNKAYCPIPKEERKREIKKILKKCNNVEVK